MDFVAQLKQKAADGDYSNKELVGKIEQIEDEMMNPKAWTMTGEAKANERPKNSLLEVHLDFNTATKLPPVITKETTDAIEALIKQRVLDELFDDPILKTDGKRRKINEAQEMDFSKSSKGLGDIYAEGLANRLKQLNPESFLEKELGGPDAQLKQEIEDISKILYQQLDTLSNFHFVPNSKKEETSIKTANVPSLMLEEAVPISISTGATKSAREVFSVQ